MQSRLIGCRLLVVGVLHPGNIESHINAVSRPGTCGVQCSIVFFCFLFYIYGHIRTGSAGSRLGTGGVRSIPNIVGEGRSTWTGY